MINVGDKIRIKDGKYEFLEGVVTKTKEVFADIKIGSIYCRLTIDNLEKINVPYTADEVFEIAQFGDIFEIEDVDEGILRFEYNNGSLLCVTSGDNFYTLIEEIYTMKDIMKMKFTKIQLPKHVKFKIEENDYDKVVEILKREGVKIY